MEAWDAVREYINIHNEGDVIYRSPLVNYVFRHIHTAGMNERTIDVYRSILTKAGYLRIIGRGAYRIEKSPEVDLTYTQAKNTPVRNIIRETQRQQIQDEQTLAERIREIQRDREERQLDREEILLKKIQEKIHGGITDEFIKKEEFQL